VRFELTTFGSGGQRAIQLRYGDESPRVSRRAYLLFIIYYLLFIIFYCKQANLANKGHWRKFFRKNDSGLV
jgi:Na+/proline symporter